jgi:hypothetical protein
MTRRRFVVRLAAAGIAAVLATGCVTQPMDDETVLELATERLGETPESLDPAEAKRVVVGAEKLGRRHAGKSKDADKVVWTKGGPTDAGDDKGGLIRDGDAEPAEDDDQSGQTQPDPAGGSDSGSTDDQQDDERRSRPSGDGDGGSGGDTGPQDGSSSGGDGDDGRGSNPSPKPDDEPDPKPEPKPTPAYSAIAAVGDREGDASGQSPRYADVRQLLIESDGKNARVTVAVAGRIPSQLAEGEVQGLGVDFYRSSERESDYQLFADGDDTGWRAFLQTQDGLVQYPGTFSIGGRVFVFKVPWSALGGRKRADVDMFIDWSQKDAGPLNKAGNDRAPDKGRVSVQPQ